MAKASEVLLAARERIERPENWQPHPAMADDRPVCLIGALYVTEFDFARRVPAYDFLEKALGTKDMDDLWKFNDSHTHAEVLALLNKAIGLALRAEGPQPELIPAHVGVADCATETTVTGHVALV